MMREAKEEGCMQGAPLQHLNLQMRKLRPSEEKGLAQGHRASQRLVRTLTYVSGLVGQWSFDCVNLHTNHL